MAASTFAKAALHHARINKPWDPVDRDALDDMKPFGFDDAGPFAAPASASKPAVPAAEAKPTSPAHEITHAAAGHSDVPAGTEKAIELQSAPATAGQQFGASMGESQPPAPQADGTGPTHSINESNLEELLDHLNRSGEQWDPGTILRVDFPQSLDDIPEHFRDRDGLGSDEEAAEKGLTFFSGSQQDAAMQAVETWSDVADVRFTMVAPGEDADIYLYAMTLDPNVGATSSGVDEDHGSRIVFNTASSAWPAIDPGTFGFHALVHEAGHSLGLSHPGEYDANDKQAPIYQDDAEYVEDTMMYSVMSYFDAEITGHLDGSTDYIVSWVATPRTHDIYVMHQLYGPNWGVRDENTTYGYNADGVSEVFDFTNYGGGGEPNYPQLTIWDGGGADWLDLSGDDSGVTLDLRPGAFSSTHGMTYNISLAYVPAGAPESAGYIENARGGGSGDTITGNERGNILAGGGGDDVLDGVDGDDELRGEDGNDLLLGGPGVDTFLGGAGVDTVDYTYSAADGTVHLSDIYDEADPDIGVWGSANVGGEDETIRDVENVTMGAGNDHITGSSLDNALLGGDGNDTLIGLAGDDWLEGNFGTDSFDGGAGIDTVNYSYSTESWTVSLASLVDDHTGTVGSATAGENDESLRDVESVVMGSGNDYVIGSSLGNTMHGGSGSDTLIGLAGDDTLFGARGDDILDGGSHDDSVRGDAGSDTLFGGSGNDFIDGGEDNDTIDGGADDDIVHGQSGSDTINGGAGADKIWGEDGADRIDGGTGDDKIVGGNSDDTISGNLGVDDLDGGNGDDLVDYTFSSDDWTVDLALETATPFNGMSESVRNFEDARMGSGNDTVRGNAAHNSFYGGKGNDQLFGFSGVDWLEGQDGDDLINGGAGNDFLFGGKGFDIASYTDEAAGVVVDLNIVDYQNTGGSGTDLLDGIEGLFGSQHNDMLYGNAGNNQLAGGLGADHLFGGGGADMLRGEDGDDTLYGGLGSDTLNGGNGTDTANYTLETSNVVVSLATQNVGQNTGAGGFDTLSGIENLAGTAYDDALIGNSGDNRLEGNSGGDILDGGDGDDVLVGGSGNDNLNGGHGDDVLEGGTGVNWALYNTGLSAYVTIDLTIETQNTFGAGTDTIRDIENVKGTSFGDLLTGNNSANELRGEGGNDWIWGGGGNDVLYGGSGIDVIDGGSGADDIIGGSGNDHFQGGTGADDFIFGNSWGNDAIWDFQSGSDRIDLSGVDGLTSFDQLEVENTDDGALYSYGSNSITLVGVSPLSVQTTDFIL
jgi:Ca2+-binding RTX toxin-like protein